MSEAAMIRQAIRNSQADALRSRGVAPGSLLDDEGIDADLAATLAGTLDADDPGAAFSDDENLAQALRRAKNEEESREAARLREEQAAEYEESLRIDQQRELEKAIRKKEEEEAARKAAEEAEEKRMRAEQKAAEAAAAEEARKKKIEETITEAREKLTDEPAKGEVGRVEVQIKTPDGRRLRRGFSSSDLVAQIYYFANVEGGEDVAGRKYRLVSAMPRCVYEDREVTFEAAGLKGQCALLMEIIEESENGDDEPADQAKQAED